MTDDRTTQIEESLDAPLEQFETELPSILAELAGEEADFARHHPELFGRLVARLDELDVAELVSENPETADQFQDLLWAGMEVLVSNDPTVQSSLDVSTTVNFEATDCPMEGHLEVDGEDNVLTGGSGTLDEATLHITGSGDNLVGLITGSVDPMQGFLTNAYSLDGPLAQGTKLAPVMDDISSTFPS